MAKQASPLDLTECESRLAPATLPQPTVTSPGTPFTIGAANLDTPAGKIQNSLQVAVDPSNSMKQVAVGGSLGDPTSNPGYGIIAYYTLDGGATWTSFLNTTGPNTSNTGRLRDPSTASTRFDAVTPSVAFGRDGMVYIVHIERTTATATTGAGVGGGVVVFDAYNFTASVPTRTVTSKELYRWTPTADAAFSPTVAVDNNVNWTDPASGLVRTDAAANKGVYVSWNTNGKTPQSTQETPVFQPNVVFMVVSGDRGANFTTPLPVSNDYRPITVANAAAPQIVFSPPQVNAATDPATTLPAKVNVAWSRVDASTITLDRSTPTNVGPNKATTFTPAAANTVTYGNGATDAAFPPPTAIQQFIGTGGDTQKFDNFYYIKSSDIRAALTNFNTTSDLITDLNIRLGLIHPNTDQLMITLTTPSMSVGGAKSVVLLDSRVRQSDGQQKPNYGTGLAHGIAASGTIGEQNGVIAGATFDDEAARGINDNQNDAPFLGSYRPERTTPPADGTNPTNDISTLFQGRTIAQLTPVNPTPGTTPPGVYGNSMYDWTLTITDVRGATSPPNPYVATLDKFELQFSAGVSRTGFGDVIDNTTLKDDTNTGTPVVALARGFADVFPTANGVSPTLGIGGFSVAFDNSQFQQDATGTPLFGNPAGSLYLAYTNGTDVKVARYAPGFTEASSDVKVNDDSAADNFSEGRGVQFEPTLAVDPTTGTVALTWYDSRFDASATRLANYIATSIDGGASWSSQKADAISQNAYTPTSTAQQPFLNVPKNAINAITREAVTIEPVPNNMAITPTPTFGFGTRQSLYFKNGQLWAYWAGNANAIGPAPQTTGAVPMRATAVTAAGPRVVDNDPANMSDQGILVPLTKTADGTPILSSFKVVFDRPISSFTAADVTLRYTSPAGVVSNVPVGAPVPDLLADPGRRIWTVPLVASESRVGTYRYTVGANVRDFAARTAGANSATVYTSTDVGVPVPAASDPGQTISTLTIPTPADNATVTDVNVSFDITHTNTGNLRIFLIAPDGVTRVLLVDQRGGFRDFTKTTLDDSSNRPIANFGNPFRGVYAPENALAAVNGQPVGGTWKLEIDDLVGGDTGTLNSWSLAITSTTTQYANALDQDADANPGEAPLTAALNGLPTVVLANDSFSTGTVNGGPVAVLPISIPGPYLVGTYATAGGTVSGTGDTLFLNKNGVSGVYLRFDRAMVPGSFTPGNVLRMTGPAGPIGGPFTVTPIFNGAGQAFDFLIGFPPQQVDGPYSIEIVPTAPGVGGTTIRSTTGFALDNNKNAAINVTLGGDPLTANVQQTTFPSDPAVTPTTVPAGQKTTYPLAVADNRQILQNLQTSPNARIQVFLDISSVTGQTPLNVTDLTADLVAPDGTRVRLFTNVGTAATGGFKTTFDDGGTLPVQAGSSQLTANGTLIPQLPLAQLLQRFPLGTWKLEITNKGGTVGQFNQWKLILPSATPGTGTGEAVADRLQLGFRLFTQDPTNPITHQQWTPVGPAGANPEPITGEQSSNTGAMTAVAVDSSDPSGNTVFAAGSTGGIYKTTNFLTTDKAGPNWIALTSFGPTNSLNVANIALVPRKLNPTDTAYDPSRTIVFALTGEPDSNRPGIGVLRSMDGGKTWQIIDSAVNFDPATPGTPLPIGDSGRNHQFVGSVGYKIIVDPNPDANTGEYLVYMALSGTNGGLYRSTTTGRSWTRISTDPNGTGSVNATDVALAAGSGPRTGQSRNLEILYVAFRGDGVYRTTQATSVTSGGLTRLDGGQGNPLILDTYNNTPVGINNVGSPSGAAGARITLAVPTLSDSVLENSFYAGWIYAFVSGNPGTLWMTKDFGDNWTNIRYEAYRPNNLTQQAFPTNNEVDAAGSANTPSRERHDIFRTDQLVNSNGVTSRSGEYSVAMTLDPTNPNVVYLAGVGSAGLRTPAQGSIRLDVTNLTDAHAFVPYDNSDANQGAAVQVATTGGIAIRDTSVLNGRVGNTTGLNPQVIGYPTNQGYLNLQRDPNNPFVTNSTVSVFNASTFVNDGSDIRWSPFNDILAPFDTSDDQRLPTADNVHRIVSFTDPVTRKTRLIYTTDQGILSGVDNGDGTLVRDGVGTTAFGSVGRNGNLQLLQSLAGAVQSSTFAADIAGALFYAAANGNGIVQGSATILPGGGTTTIAQTGLIGNWTGPTGTTIGVATDQTGSGISYQHRLQGEYGYSANSYASTDFFRVQLPPGDTFDGTISQTSGLFFGDTSQFDNLGGQTNQSYFAINPIDRNGGLISARNGRLFRSTSLANTAVGNTWFVVAEPGQLDSSVVTAPAFGAPATGSGFLNNFLYAGTRNGNIYVSTTGQAPWTNTTPAGLGSQVLKVVPSPYRDSHAAYAVTQNGVFYNPDTLDTTQTWTDVTGDLFQLQRPLLGISSDKTNALTTITGTKLQLTSLAVDWRYQIPDDLSAPNGAKHPVLYVSGDSGVFRSRTNGATWTYFPDVNEDGAAYAGGYLPSVKVTDLDLSLGDINPLTGQPNQANGGLNMLVATTYGRGQYAIRLNTTLDAQFNAQFQSGPTVTKVATPTPVGGVSSLKFFFSGPVDSSTVSTADFDIRDPNGNPVTVTSAALTSVPPGPGQSNPFNEYTITFATPAAEDFYKVTVGPNLSDFAGNLMNQNGNTTNGEADDSFVRFIYLNGKAADSLSLDGLPRTVVAGQAATFTVSVLTPTGDVDTAFTGKIHFTSTDMKQVAGADLPADYTFVAGDAGKKAFTVTFKTAGTQSITAVDALSPALPSMSTLVNPGRADTVVTNATADHFAFSAIPSPVTAGTNQTFTLTAFDAFNNLAKDFTGSVDLTSSDPQFVVTGPSNPVTFAAADNGVVTITAQFRTAGAQTVTATRPADPATTPPTPAITGTSNAVTVNPAATSKFVVSGLVSPFNAGDTKSFQVRPQDPFGNNSTDFAGQVTFTSTDPNAVFNLNPTTAFTPGAPGTFLVQLRNAGPQTITATATANSSITGSQAVTVTPAAVSGFALTNYATSLVAGGSTAVTVTAVAPDASTAVGYLGTVHFSSTDVQAGLPTDYTFTIADNGVHVFNITLKTAGSQLVSVNDTATPATSGTTPTPIVVTPAAAANFAVSGFPSPTTAGATGGLTIAASDIYGNVATTYTGTVTITSSDGQAVLPPAYTFMAGDAGVKTLPVTLKTAGTQSITATDAASNLSGTQSNISVAPAAATRFTLGGHASPVQAGTPSAVTLTAFDAFNNQATGYAGTVHFTSTDPLASLPADVTFSAANQGSATVADTLRTVGTQTVTATDTANAALTASQGGIVVTPAPITGPGVPTGTIALSGFPSPTTAGVPQTFTVSVRDGFGNVATGYTGTLHFTSSDGLASLPADYTFTAADAGVHTFTASLGSVGTQSITATDTATPALTATQSGIAVTPAAGASLTATKLANAVAGTEQQIFIEVRDAFGNLATNYTGTLHFASSDAQAGLPADYTFSPADGGRKIFKVTLKTAGTQTVSLADTVTPSLAASQSGIQVTGAAPAKFKVILPASAVAGSPTAFQVSTTDLYGNPTTGFTGVVGFTSSDPRAELPTNTAFTSADGGTKTFVATFHSPNATQSITVTSFPLGANSFTGTGSIPVQANFTTRPGVVGTRQFAVATDDNSSQPVKVYDGTGAVRFATFPFPGDTTPGGGRVATADFNGDGTDDLVVGTSPGNVTGVVIIDGATQQQLFSRQPFESAFTGGVYVTTGDLTGDNVPDLIITPDEGGGPRATVIDGKTFAVVIDFFGIDDPNFRGGARAAVGDLNGDGVGDLLVAAGFGGGPRVAGYDGKALAAGQFVKLFNDFFAFEQDLRNGVFIAAGDIDGDGKADMIVGGGPGGGPRVTAFSGSALLTNTQDVLANFFGGDTNNRGGVRVVAKDLDNDNRADIVIGSGTGAGSHVTAYLGTNITRAGTPPAALDFDAFPGDYTGGVFVG